MSTKVAELTQGEVSGYNDKMRNQAVGDVLSYAGAGALTGVSLAALSAIYRRLTDYMSEKKDDKKALGPVIAVKPTDPVKVAQEQPGNPNDVKRSKEDFGWYWPSLVAAPLLSGVAAYTGVNALSKWMRNKDMDEKKKKLEQQFQDELALTLKDQNLTLTKGASINIHSLSDEDAAILFIDMIKDGCNEVCMTKRAFSTDTFLGLLLAALAGTGIAGGVMGYNSTRPTSAQNQIDLIKKRRVITALTTPAAPLVVSSEVQSPTDDDIEEENKKKKQDASIPVGAAPNASVSAAPVLPMG